MSRRYGICGKGNDDFVIIDKEAVVGYSDNAEKNKVFGTAQKKYKSLQRIISETNPHRFGKNLEEKSIGNELDFLALDKEGNILIIEYKYGTNTSGIYLSPLQIGMYFDLFSNLPRSDLEDAIYQMLVQKQGIGLINPKWGRPSIKSIVPVLIISEYNYRSSAMEKFQEILNITRNNLGSKFLNNIKTYNYNKYGGLTNW